MARKRAMSSEKASFVKLEGHRIERIYAGIIGGGTVKGTSKKDVRDKLGKIHSVKGAQLKWQIFLYGRNRFERDFGNLGKIFMKCIDSFPEKRDEITFS